MLYRVWNRERRMWYNIMKNDMCDYDLYIQIDA